MQRKQKRIIVVVDTREQRPWSFSRAECDVEVGTLQTGDYSLRGLCGVLAVERKSLDDLVGSVIHGRKRFERECQRLSRMAFKVVVVEAPLRHLLMGAFKSAANPQSVLGAVTALQLDYDVPFVFANGRDEAQAYAWRWLLNAKKRAE